MYIYVYLYIYVYVRGKYMQSDKPTEYMTLGML